MSAFSPACASLAAWLALATAACSDPRTVHWRFEFGDEADVDRAGVVEGAIRKGRCDGEVVFSTATAGDSATEAPGALGPGRYALTGVARDANCVRFAAGCADEIDLPIDDGATIQILLEHVGDTADCGLGYCDQGVCGEVCDDPQTEICNDQDDDCGGVADDADVEEGDEPDAEVLRACPGFVVISEIAEAGLMADGVTHDGGNEFVELYNRREFDVALGEATFWILSPGETDYRLKATLPVGARLPSYGHYLLGTYRYAIGVSAPARDVGASWQTASTVGGVRFETPDGAIDRVAWGSGGTGGEDRALAGIPDEVRSAASYERKARTGSTAASLSADGADESCGNGYDTDDNAEDFVLRAPRDPQNSASDPEPPCDP